MAKHVAFDEKNYIMMQKRENEYESFLSFCDKHFLKHVNTHSFILYPSVGDENIAKELLKKLQFALPKQDIFVSFKNDIKVKKDKYIHLLKEDELLKNIKTSVVLVWDMSVNLDMLKDALNIEMIDKNFFSYFEAEAFEIMYGKYACNQEKYQEQTRKNFDRFYKKNILKKISFCFTTGPSFSEYESFSFPNNILKIVCNSTIKNDKFIKHINGVDLLVFADPVFHFGASNYAEAFRKDAIKAVEKYDCFVGIPSICVPLMTHYYPQIKHRLIGFEFKDTFNFPTQKSISVKATSNILTLFMLPIASSFAEYIFILGADGRGKKEKYFWQHSKDAQYDKKMESAFLAHPSFFRDTDYEAYYEQHCEVLEELIKYGESLGKKYASITQSYIPALKNRFINFHEKIEDVVYKMQNDEHIVKKSKYNFAKISQKQTSYIFSKQLNYINSYVDFLLKNKLKIAIYGNGVFGKLLSFSLAKNLVAVFDKNTKSTNKFAPVLDPKYIKDHEFDVLIVCVLGREDEIIKKNLQEVAKQKILIFDMEHFTYKNTLVLDRNDKSFLETNLFGPYSKNSIIDFDESELICLYMEDKKNGLMFDVGACYGDSAKGFLKNGWYVYAYEPDLTKIEAIKENLRDFKNYQLSQKALSDKKDKNIPFYASKQSVGISSLVAFTDTHEQLCEVQTTTLLNEIKKHKISHIDFLKIDTEGFDLLVLKGLGDFSPDVILCEFENLKTKNLNYNTYDSIEFLQKKGYVVYVSEWYPIIRYGIKHNWKRIFKYTNQHIPDDSWGNLIAFKKADEQKLKSSIERLLGLS